LVDMERRVRSEPRQSALQLAFVMSAVGIFCAIYLQGYSFIFAEPLDKLVNLIEDIFDAEDSLDPSAFDDTEKLAAGGFFSSLSTSPNAPLLSVSMMAKVTKIVKKLTISQSQRRRKSFAVTRSPNSRDNSRGGISSLDVTMLTRILRTLARSIKVGEDIGIAALFPRSKVSNDAPPSPTKGSPTKGSATMLADAEPEELLEEEEAKLSRNIHALKESLSATEACLALLASDHLPKQVSSQPKCADRFSSFS
jgi:cohesin loading factor subunit SCC2